MNAVQQLQLAARTRPPVQPRFDRLDMLTFFESAWRNVLQPSAPFRPDRAIEAYCAHAEALLNGQGLPYLMVNVGPGHMKSWFWSVVYPTIIWARTPGAGIICASRNLHPLGARDANRCLKLCRSEWYRRHSPSGARIVGDAALQVVTRDGGHRVTISVNGSTGLRGEHLILDDPMTYEQAHSPAFCDGVYDWMAGDFLQRMNEGGRIAMVMQRLSMADPMARWLSDFGDKTDLLSLQEERSRIFVTGPSFGQPGFAHTPGESCTALTRSGAWVDDRQEGELLAPEAFGRERVDLEKRNAYNWHAQRQQAPLPVEAGARMLHEYQGTINFRSAYGMSPAEAVTKGWQPWAAFDHGIGAGREFAVVGLLNHHLNRIVVLRDYRNARRTVPIEDAWGVRALFDQLGVNPFTVTHAVGDVGNTGKGDVTAQTINQALRDARRPYVALPNGAIVPGPPILGFRIDTAFKGQGSLTDGCELLNMAFRNGMIQVDEQCQDLDTSLKGWTGGDQHKDLCDALRYGCYPIITRWTKKQISEYQSA